MSIPHGRFKTAVHALAVVAYLPLREATSDKVAASVSTDPSAARRLLSMLRSAGLLHALEGRGGGYTLARPASEIHLDEVYRAVCDETVFPTPARIPNLGCPIGSRIYQVLETPVAAAEGALRRSLNETSLADLMRELKA